MRGWEARSRWSGQSPRPSPLPSPRKRGEGALRLRQMLESARSMASGKRSIARRRAPALWYASRVAERKRRQPPFVSKATWRPLAAPPRPQSPEGPKRSGGAAQPLDGDGAAWPTAIGDLTSRHGNPPVRRLSERGGAGVKQGAEFGQVLSRIVKFCQGFPWPNLAFSRCYDASRAESPLGESSLASASPRACLRSLSCRMRSAIVLSLASSRSRAFSS